MKWLRPKKHFNFCKQNRSCNPCKCVTLFSHAWFLQMILDLLFNFPGLVPSQFVGICWLDPDCYVFSEIYFWIKPAECFNSHLLKGMVTSRAQSTWGLRATSPNFHKSSPEWATIICSMLKCTIWVLLFKDFAENSPHSKKKVFWPLILVMSLPLLYWYQL